MSFTIRSDVPYVLGDPLQILESFRAAFKQWVDEVHTGAWPDGPNLVSAPKAEMDAFQKMISGK